MSTEPTFGNWMVAIADAAEVAGAPDLDSATAEQMGRAWDLVGETAKVPRDQVTASIAMQAGIPVAEPQTADTRAQILLPAEVAHRHNVLPLHCTDRDVAIATANPMNQKAKREFSNLTGRVVRFQLAEPRALKEAVEAAYGPAGEAGERPPDSEAWLNKGPHVLVVDDEAGQRAWFRSVLEAEGYRVTVATDGRAALDILASDSSVELVTLDYWMDKLNGLRALQLIRADRSMGTVPVIMVTGAGDRRIEMSLFEAGADDFIAKPIDPPLFLLRVQAVLRRRSFG